MHLAEVLLSWLSADAAEESLLYAGAWPSRQDLLESAPAPNSRWREMAWQPLRQETSYRRMAPEPIDNSLEALTNLLYLIRRTLNDPARAEAYLDVVDKVLADIAGARAHCPVQAPRD
jgi:hypothetical protein